jgi:hypothetical protein
MNKSTDKNANLYNSINNITSNKEQVTSNKQQLIYRFASDDKSSNDKRSILREKELSDSTASNRFAQKDFSFITEKYEQAAQKLVREDIFSVSFSLLGEKTADRRSMNLDIILKPGDKPLKYKVDMIKSRYAYELTNKLSDKEQTWHQWDLIKEALRESDCMWGKLRNRTSNTRIVPRKRIPYCVAGIEFDSEVNAVLILGNNTHIKCQIEPVKDKTVNKIFVAKGTWVNPEWDEGEYEVEL